MFGKLSANAIISSEDVNKIVSSSVLRFYTSVNVARRLPPVERCPPSLDRNSSPSLRPLSEAFRRPLSWLRASTVLCSALVRRFLLDLSTANLASLPTKDRLVCAHNTMTASERNKLHSGQNAQARLSSVLKSRRIRMIFPGFFLLCFTMYSFWPFSSDGHIFHASERVYGKFKNGTFYDNRYTDYAQKDMDWSLFAYVQYVTSPAYLCNSLMMLESLYRLGTKADLVMLYPKEWKVPSSPKTSESIESAQLARARDEYGAKLVPIEIQSHDAGESIWAEKSYEP